MGQRDWLVAQAERSLCTGSVWPLQCIDCLQPRCSPIAVKGEPYRPHGTDSKPLGPGGDSWGHPVKEGYRQPSTSLAPPAARPGTAPSPAAAHLCVPSVVCPVTHPFLLTHQPLSSCLVSTAACTGATGRLCGPLSTDCEWSRQGAFPHNGASADATMPTAGSHSLYDLGHWMSVADALK